MTFLGCISYKQIINIDLLRQRDKKRLCLFSFCSKNALKSLIDIKYYVLEFQLTGMQSEKNEIRNKEHFVMYFVQYAFIAKLQQ